MTNNVYHILYLEDNAFDAELVAGKLENAGAEYRVIVTDREKEFKRLLKEERIDLVLSDHSLPNYSGARALEHVKEKYPEIPFIFISGVMGEEAAVESLLKGASDYILKNNTVRLVPAIKRALDEASKKRRLKQAEKRLKWETEINKAFSTLSQTIVMPQSDIGAISKTAIEVSRTNVLCECFFIYLPGAEQNRVIFNTGEEIKINSFVKSEDQTHSDKKVNCLIKDTLQLSSPVYKEIDEEQVIVFCELKRYNVQKNYFLVPAIIDKEISGYFILVDLEEKPDDQITRFLCRIAELYAIGIKRRESEQALRESEATLKSIFKAAPIGIGIVRDRRFMYVNDSVVRVLGYPREEMYGNSSRMIYESEADFERIGKIKYDAMRKRSLHSQETRFVKKNGEVIDVLLRTCAMDKNDLSKGTIFTFVDISERKKAIKALEESEERFRSLYENATLGLYRITLGGTMLLANPALVEMMGYNSFGEFRRTDIKTNIYLNPPDRQKMLEELNQYGSVRGFETKWIKKNGQIIDVRISARAIKYERDEIEYIEGVVEDFSERKKAENMLVSAKEQAEKSDRLKTEFLAQMSHEIRTPINTIVSFTNLIEADLSDLQNGDLHDAFGMIDSASKRVIRTIDLILNMSELQIGSYDFRPRSLDLLTDVIQHVYNDYIYAANDRGLKLTILNQAEKSKIIADEYSVIQIFTNLIDNAIKYTPAGEIKLILEEDDDNMLAVTVEDTGIGISEEYLPHIFDSFTQEEHGYTRQFEGNGLGLSLVKKYCEMNKAEINIQSQKGKGTGVKVTFPSA